MDVVGAFVGEHALQVVHVTNYRILQTDAAGAEHGPGLAGRLQGLFHVAPIIFVKNPIGKHRHKISKTPAMWRGFI